MTSHFAEVASAPGIEVFALVAEYNADNHPKKVNLSVGAYRTDEGKPWVLPVVKTVEQQMAADLTSNHEYLPVAGLPSFREAACQLLLGSDSPALKENRVEGIQVLGGTGGIRLAAEFLKKILKKDCVYVSKPTWPNHLGVFRAAGFSQIKEYRYWNEEKRNLNFDGMMEDFRNANEGDVVILHACAHNPTGCDPSREQWDLISKVCKERKLFVLMDSAYQGFMSGSLDDDAWAVRHFVASGHELFISSSFSKNFGLYNERIGNLCIVMESDKFKPAVKSQMEIIIRQTWSNPSYHGARIVSTVLNDPTLCAEWKVQLKQMADRIIKVRELMKKKLVEKGTPGTWNHIVDQQGMFTYTGLNPQQVKILKEEYHIYLMKSGRISMCGLNESNVGHVVDAIHEAVQRTSNL